MTDLHTTAAQRAERLAKLYTLQGNVARQIAAIEAEIANEARQLARIKKAARQIGASVGKAKTAQCGTDSGYYRHRRQLNEAACTACLIAHRLAERARAERRALRDGTEGAA